MKPLLLLTMKFLNVLLALIVSLAFLGTSVLSQEAATADAVVTDSAEAATTTETPHATDDSASALDVDAAAEEATEQTTTESEATTEAEPEAVAEPVQSGPLIDLFGPQLLKLELIDEQTGQLSGEYTNEALSGKNVIGIYFSADW